MKNLIIIFSIFFLLLACKREKMWFNDTTVEGIVLDSATLEPIIDVEIILYWNKSKHEVIRGNYVERKDIKSRTTDKNGKFKIKFNRVEGRTYFVDLSSVIDKYNMDQYNIVYFYMNNKEFINIGSINIDTLNSYGPTILIKTTN